MADIVFRTVSLPAAQVGVPYEAGIAETGAATAITAGTVSTGALPNGLALSADYVRITGTPTKAGVYSFKVTLTDTAGAVASPSYAISVGTAGHPDRVNDINSQPLAASLAREWPATFQS